MPVIFTKVQDVSRTPLYNTLGKQKYGTCENSTARCNFGSSDQAGEFLSGNLGEINLDSSSEAQEFSPGKFWEFSFESSNQVQEFSPGNFGEFNLKSSNQAQEFSPGNFGEVSLESSNQAQESSPGNFGKFNLESSNQAQEFSPGKFGEVNLESNNNAQEFSPGKFKEFNLESNNKAQEFSPGNFGEFEIWKNLLILSISLMLWLTPFYSMSILQTTLNKDGGLGAITLTLAYLFSIISSIFLPSLIIHYLGEKLCISIILVNYIPYMASNAIPTWATMIPTAILVGIGIGPFWVATSTYVQKLSVLYVRRVRNNSTESDIYNRFTGIYYAFLWSGKIWGSLMASVFFEPDRTNCTEPTPEAIHNCLLNKNPADVDISSLERPKDEQVYLICGVWVGMGALAVIVSCFLSPINSEHDRKETTGTMITKKLKATLTHIKESRTQQLLVPMSLYYGMTLGFFSADYAKSFVGCILGIEYVGYILMCHGIVNAISTYVFGRLVKHVGHIPFFTLCFLIHGTIQTTLLAWSPTVATSWTLYVISGFWGVADAILRAQTITFYGHTFKANSEAAYGIYFTCESVGVAITFAFSTYLSTVIKLQILLICLIISAVLYYIVEYIERRREKFEDK